MVPPAVVGPQRVDHADRDRRLEERGVVVATVPHDDVGFRGGCGGDRGVVHPGEHHRPLPHGLLVLLALLDGGTNGVDVGEGGEALHPRGRQVAVGHRVADQRHPQAGVAQEAGDPAARGRLSRPGAGRDHRDDGHGARDHRQGRGQETKGRARRQHS